MTRRVAVLTVGAVLAAAGAYWMDGARTASRENLLVRS